MKLVLLFATLLVLGCQEDDAPVYELAGRQFMLKLTIGWQPSDPDFDTVRVGFEESELTLNAGCNDIFGEYEIRGGKLVIDSVGMTDRACTEDGPYQDRWFSMFLTSRPRLTLDENKLTLTGADATIVFLESATVP